MLESSAAEPGEGQMGKDRLHIAPSKAAMPTLEKDMEPNGLRPAPGSPGKPASCALEVND